MILGLEESRSILAAPNDASVKDIRNSLFHLTTDTIARSNDQIFAPLSISILVAQNYFQFGGGGGRK